MVNVTNDGWSGNARRTYRSHGLKVGRRLVFVVLRVGNLLGFPDTLVRGIVDERGGPLALVGRVLLHRRLPLAAARGLLAFGIGHGGRNPVTILVVVPVLGLLGFGIRDHGRLVIEPVIRLLGVFIHDLVRRIFVPIVRFGGIRVRNARLVHPVIRLGVVGIVNLLGWIDRGGEIFQQGAVLDALAVDPDLEALVWLDDQRV